MVRNSVTHLILFIAVVGASTLFVGVLTGQVGLYAQSIEQDGERTAADIDADVLLVDDPEAGTVYDEDAGTVTLYAKNVGGATLEPADLEVLVDGAYVERDAVSTRVLGDDHWREGRVLELAVNRTLEVGDHRALVRIGESQDALEFEHRLAYWLEPSGPGTSATDCDDGSCTVDANETDTLTLTTGTDPDQEGESVSYAVNDTAVASVDPTAGTTDANGEDETTLELRRNGTVSVTLDTGWDDDEILVTVVNATDPLFEVSEFDAPDSAARDDQLTANATVENVGAATDTQTIEYRFDGVVEYTTEVTLEPDERTVVEFTHTVDSSDGSYTHGIYSDDDGDSGTITVG